MTPHVQGLHNTDFENAIILDHQPIIFNSTLICQHTAVRALGYPFRGVNSSTSTSFKDAWGGTLFNSLSAAAASQFSIEELVKKKKI